MIIRSIRVCVLAIFVFVIASTLHSQNFITPSSPYNQDWNSTTLAADGWSVIIDDGLSETLVPRNGGQALEINADFSGRNPLAFLDGPEFRLEGSSELSEITVSLDLFMSERDARVTLELFNIGSTSETLLWHWSNDAANAWQTYSFLLDSYEGTYSGSDAFDIESDFQMSILMDGSWWGEDAGNRMRLDNVSISIVPESSTSFLVALAFCMLVILKTRCRNHAHENAFHHFQKSSFSNHFQKSSVLKIIRFKSVSRMH